MSSSSSSTSASASLLDNTDQQSGIIVRIEDGEFFIALGTGGGSQTVRWLAYAALARFYEAGKTSSGYIRTRTATTLLHQNTGSLRTKPSLQVSTAGTDQRSAGIGSVTIEWDRAFIGPDTTINEIRKILTELGEEATHLGIRVHLLPPLWGTSNNGGGYDDLPHSTNVFSPLWYSLAHSYTKTSEKHAQELLEIHKEEVRKQRALEAEEKEKELQIQMKKLSRLLQSDVEDPEVLEKNFLFDWSNVRTNLITSNNDIARRLRRAMWTWYPSICDLFRHFSGGSTKGSVATMQKQELTHMLVLATAMDLVKERKIFDRLFERSNVGRADDKALANDNDPNSLSRYELLEFLASFADVKFGQDIDLKSNEPIGAAAAFTKFMTEKMAPLINKLNAGPVRAALKEPSIQKFLLPRLPVLMEVYHAYALLDDEGFKPKRPSHKDGKDKHGKHHKHGSKHGSEGSSSSGGASTGGGSTGGDPNQVKKPNLMNLDEFLILLEHSGLLDDVTVMKATSAKEGATAALKNNKATLTAQEVRETFSGAQRDNDDSGIHTAEEELTFGEFLEAIGRVAIAKWGDSAGLKFVMDPRQLSRQPANPTASMSADFFAKAERTIVRALIMWACLAVEDLGKHIGKGVKSPVQYDVNELLRLVSLSSTDYVAASSTRGVVKTPDQIEADRLAELAEQNNEVMTGPGVDIFSHHHPIKPKAAFGTLRGLALPPGRNTVIQKPGTIGIGSE